MAPLIHSPSISPSSSHDDLFDLKTRNIAPLHELANERGSPTRRVSFSRMSMKYNVMNRDDYSAEEFKASWFDIDDMIRMKEDARSTAKLYCSGSLILGEEVSMRGLEHRTREGIKRKRKARMNSYGAVFYELSKQRKDDAYAQEMVAQSYAFYSQNSVKEALSVARQDEAEAIAIYGKDDCFETNYFHQVIDDLMSSMD